MHSSKFYLDEDVNKYPVVELRGASPHNNLKSTYNKNKKIIKKEKKLSHHYQVFARWHFWKIFLYPNLASSKHKTSFATVDITFYSFNRKLA